MMILSTLAGLTFVGSIVSLITSETAPEGYEDATGFHYGSPKPAIAAEWDAGQTQVFTQRV